jgi:hypothetical protein
VKILQKLIFISLVASINITLSAYLLSATLLSAHYWQAKADSTSLYASLSQSLPKTLIPGSGPETQAAQQGIAVLLSDSYLKGKVSPFVEQLQKYYQGKGPAPQLDLTDLAQEAQRQGVQVPENSPIIHPLTPDTPKGIKAAYSWINLIKSVGVVIVLVLAGMLTLLHSGWHRFTALGKVLVVSALGQGLLFLVLKFSPGLLGSLVKPNANTVPLAETVVSFSQSLLIDVSNHFGVAAIGLAVIGVVVFIAGLIYKTVGFVGRRSGGEKGDGRYKRPETDTRPPL